MIAHVRWIAKEKESSCVTAMDKTVTQPKVGGSHSPPCRWRSEALVQGCPTGGPRAKCGPPHGLIRPPACRAQFYENAKKSLSLAHSYQKLWCFKINCVTCKSRANKDKDVAYILFNRFIPNCSQQSMELLSESKNSANQNVGLIALSKINQIKFETENSSEQLNLG